MRGHAGLERQLGCLRGIHAVTDIFSKRPRKEKDRKYENSVCKSLIDFGYGEYNTCEPFLKR